MDRGTGNGSEKSWSGRMERAWAIWAEPIRRARRPCGLSNRAAREGGFEAFDCAERDHVERGWGQSFCADILYIDVRQCKGASDLAKKGGFLVVRLDEGQRD